MRCLRLRSRAPSWPPRPTANQGDARVKTNRILGRGAAAAGLCLLWAVPGAGGAQSPPAPTRPPAGHMSIVPDSKLKQVDPMDDFAGVNFTAEQKARVQQIREKSRSRMHDVAVDTKLSPE